MLTIIIIILAAILILGLLYFEKWEKRKGVLPTKTLLSLLFILTALVQPHPVTGYYHLLLGGLVFCMGGDVFLALPQKKMFLFGLVSFVLGHIFYVLAFFSVARISLLTWVGSLIVLVISSWVYLWLRPHLGSMSVPVLLYVIVITMMVSGTWSVLSNATLTVSGRMMVCVGAFSFYFSDLFVARDRFLKREFLNRFIGLPLYYAGQFLLAFSVGFLT